MPDEEHNLSAHIVSFSLLLSLSHTLCQGVRVCFNESIKMTKRTVTPDRLYWKSLTNASGSMRCLVKLVSCTNGKNYTTVANVLATSMLYAMQYKRTVAEKTCVALHHNGNVLSVKHTACKAPYRHIAPVNVLCTYCMLISSFWWRRHTRCVRTHVCLSEENT